MATVKTTRTTVVTSRSTGGGTHTTHHTTTTGVCTVNVSYPKSLPGILKIIEFVSKHLVYFALKRLIIKD